MRIRKEDIIVIILAGILVLIVIIMIFISFNQGGQTSTAPSATVTTEPTLPSFLQEDPINYDVEASIKLWDKVDNKPPLSATDAAAKNTTIISILHGIESGVLYESPQVRLEYVKSLDMFLAEITTTKLSSAKAEVNTWLRGQGLTQEGICNLPVIFYVNLESAEKLQGENIVFKPSAPGC